MGLRSLWCNRLIFGGFLSCFLPVVYQLPWHICNFPCGCLPLCQTSTPSLGCRENSDTSNTSCSTHDGCSVQQTFGVWKGKFCQIKEGWVCSSYLVGTVLHRSVNPLTKWANITWLFDRYVMKFTLWLYFQTTLSK